MSGVWGVVVRPRLWPWVLGAVLGYVVAAIVVVGAFAAQAAAVHDDLGQAKADLADLVGDIRAGQAGDLDARIASIVATTDAARATVGTPLWDLASSVPLVGQNVTAVKDVIEATDVLVQDALPIGLQLVTSVDVDNLGVQGGGLDLAPFAAAQSSLPELQNAFSRAAARVAGIDRDELLPVVDDAIAEVLDVIEQGGPSVSMLQQYLPTLLQMAGSEGPRHYLVVVQNLAETRASGGNPAASFVVTLDGGRLTMGDQANSGSFQTTSGTPYLDLPAETAGLYERDTTSYVQNFTRTPDFPTTAALFQSAWRSTTGQEVDGVVSVDPAVLAAVLSVTGPVAVADGTEITADNAVASVLRDVYQRYPGDSTPVDAYFADVASAVFEKVAAGGWSPLDMLDRLGDETADHRVLAWFPREGEQAVARDLGLTGSLAAPDRPGTEIGVFLNDSGYDKLGFYLSASVAVTCDAAAGTATTSVTLSSAVPGGDLPWYVTNNRAWSQGEPRTTMFVDVLGVAPAGGTVVSIDPATGDLGWDRSGTDTGRDVESRSIILEKGATRTVSFVSTIPAGQGPITVRTTPMVGETPVSIDASCAALGG